MSIEAAHRSYWQTSEVVFGIPFLVAIVLQLLVPVSLPRGLFSPAFFLGGAAPIIVGVAWSSLPAESSPGKASRRTLVFRQARL